MNKIKKLLLLLPFFALILTFFVFQSQNNVQAEGSQISSLTNQLVNSKNSSDTKSLIKAAQDRQSLLIKEAQYDQKQFLKDATLASQKASFPKEVQPFIEENKTLAGPVTNFYADNFKTNQGGDYYVVEQDKVHYFISYSSQEKFKDGTNVTFQALSISNFAVASSAEQVSAKTMTSSALTAVTGTKNVLILKVRFNGDTSTPHSNSMLNDNFFTDSDSVNDFYDENSYGNLALTGDVHGYYNITIGAGEDCQAKFYDWATKANTLATNDGVNVGSYDIVVYDYINTDTYATCSPIGLGTNGLVGIYDWTKPLIYHEFGHGLGLDHSSGFYYCNQGTVPIDSSSGYSNCLYNTYLDPTSTMGGGLPYQLTAIQKMALGWIPTSNMQTVSTNGTYTIAPSEANTSSYQILKISKPNTSQYYYLEYKQPVSGTFDAALPAPGSRGVTLRIWDESSVSNPSFMIPLGLDPQIQKYYSGGPSLEPALKDRSYFFDQENNILIKQLSHNSSGVVLQITFSASAPTPQNNVTTDFDNDGDADIAVYRPSDQTFYINGIGNTAFGAAGDLPTPGDFNGNGTTALGTFRPSTTAWWLSDGAWGTNFGGATDIPVTGDYDGDGKADRAMWRANDGGSGQAKYYVEYSSNSSTVNSGLWGYSSDIPALGDYDGDGKTDYAVWRPSDGYFYIKYASGSTENIGPLGTTGDIPVPGDYNGDGITEPAVWRASDGKWYIWQENFQIIKGTTGDWPVPADYNGDGKTDYAFYRSSDYGWRVPSGTVTWGFPTDKILERPAFYIY